MRYLSPNWHRLYAALRAGDKRDYETMVDLSRRSARAEALREHIRAGKRRAYAHKRAVGVRQPTPTCEQESV